MSLAKLLIRLIIRAFAAAIFSVSPESYASRRALYVSAGNFESIGRYTNPPSSIGIFTANSTTFLLPGFVATFSSYCSGERISLSIAPSWISPKIPLVFTFESTFFKSPTPAATVCISPKPLYTCSRRSLTSLNDLSILSSRVFCSFSSTVCCIFSSCLLLSLRIISSRFSMVSRICKSRAALVSSRFFSRSSICCIEFVTVVFIAACFSVMFLSSSEKLFACISPVSFWVFVSISPNAFTFARFSSIMSRFASLKFSPLLVNIITISKTITIARSAAVIISMVGYLR